MNRILIVAGVLWFAFATAFVLALMCAARRGFPPETQAEHDSSPTTVTPFALRGSDPGADEEPAIPAREQESIAAHPGMVLASSESHLHASDWNP